MGYQLPTGVGVPGTMSDNEYLINDDISLPLHEISHNHNLLLISLICNICLNKALI